MNGTQRSIGNSYGYSIWEMEVYGTQGTPVPDSDNDGVNDNLDQCANTQAGE